MPRIDRSSNSGKTNTEKSTHTPADQLHHDSGQQPLQDHYRHAASEVIRQSLSQPERPPQKRTSHQSARSNESISALRSLPLRTAAAIDESANPEGQRKVPALVNENHTGQNDSEHNGDDNNNESRTELVSTTRDLSETYASHAEIDLITNEVDPDTSRPSHPTSRPTATTAQMLSSSRGVSLRSETATVLIEELLNIYVKSVDLSPRFSLNKSQLALPKAGPKEKRRIQQAFAVTDSINIIAVRISQNNSDQHQTRSLLDALIDLLYLLVDLLNPVMDFIDPAAKRAARTQLVQLAFMTPCVGRLRVACEAATSLLGEDHC